MKPSSLYLNNRVYMSQRQWLQRLGKVRSWAGVRVFLDAAAGSADAVGACDAPLSSGAPRDACPARSRRARAYCTTRARPIHRGLHTLRQCNGHPLHNNNNTVVFISNCL